MRYAFFFALLAFLSFWSATDTQGGLALQALFFALALCFAGVALAFALARPGLLLKRPSGRLSPASYLLYWPYLTLNMILLAAVRGLGRGRPFDEIVPGLYLGGRLLPRDKDACFVKQGSFAVLDLTAEFDECSFLRVSACYRCLPLLDTAAPTPEQLDEGSRWIAAQLRERPVYVHCALGRSRSATFVAAYLLASRRAQNAEQALGLIRSRRPGIGLNSRQRAALEAFERRLKPSSESNPP